MSKPTITMPTEASHPWWWYRCTHREHEYWMPDSQSLAQYGCWRVLREAEHVVVLHLICLGQVHILVDADGVGSVCKTMTKTEYSKLSEPDVLKLVQDQFRELKNTLLH